MFIIFHTLPFIRNFITMDPQLHDFRSVVVVHADGFSFSGFMSFPHFSTFISSVVASPRCFAECVVEELHDCCKLIFSRSTVQRFLASNDLSKPLPWRYGTHTQYGRRTEVPILRTLTEPRRWGFHWNNQHEAPVGWSHPTSLPFLSHHDTHVRDREHMRSGVCLLVYDIPPRRNFRRADRSTRKL